MRTTQRNSGSVNFVKIIAKGIVEEGISLLVERFCSSRGRGRTRCVYNIGNMKPPNLIRIYGNIKATVIWGLELNPKSEKIDFNTSTWCLDQWGWSLNGTVLMDEDSKWYYWVLLMSFNVRPWNQPVGGESKFKAAGRVGGSKLIRWLRMVYILFDLCCSPMENDASHKSTVRYKLTGKAVGMSSLTCHAVKLNGQEISSKSEEVQVYFLFELDSLQDYGRIVFCVFRNMVNAGYVWIWEQSEWNVLFEFKMNAVFFYVELKIQFKIFFHTIPAKLFPYYVSRVPPFYK